MPTVQKSQPFKRPLNLYIDGDLADVYKKYCTQNRKAGSMAQAAEEMIIRLIASKGKKYGLKVPAHLA